MQVIRKAINTCPNCGAVVDSEWRSPCSKACNIELREYYDEHLREKTTKIDVQLRINEPFPAINTTDPFDCDVRTANIILHALKPLAHKGVSLHITSVTDEGDTFKGSEY